MWAAVLATFATTRPATAQYVWNNPAGGNWTVAGNWTGGVPVPGATTTLTFGTAATQSATYTATNDIGGAGTPFDLNALTINNTSGTVTVTGNPLNFTGAAPSASVAGAGNMIISAPVNLGTSLTVAGAGTGGFTIAGALAGGANNIVKTSSGALTMSGGGTLNRLSVQAGGAFITGGTLALTSPTGTGNVDAGLQLGAASGQTAAATVSGGATVNVTENTYVGDAAGSTGTLTVTGAGTVLNGVSTVSGRFGVGNAGTGTLNVTAGGVVNVNQLFVARLAGGNGGVVVDGAGSVLRAITQLSFGTAGLGTMTVQNGGLARSDGSINIGRAVGAGINGVVTVTGAGSTMTTGVAGTAGGSINVGLTGPGTLNVQNGAAVTTGVAGFDGQLTVGSAVNSAGVLNVNSGGTVTVTGSLFSGVTGPNTAAITVNGAGSLLTVSNQFSLSGGGGAGVNAGAVTLDVTAGGQVQVTGLSLLGQNAGGSAAATVSGTGSSFSGVGQLQLNNGTNNLNVQAGGTVSNTGAVFVGSATGASAVTVTGDGSAFTTPSAINVGGTGGVASAGTGTVSAGNGGAVTATGGLVVYAPGTVNVNAGGTLSAGSVADGSATSFGTVNVAAGRTLAITDGGGATFTGLITGGGAVSKSGGGTQTLAGPNNYSGGTTVGGGTLTVTNAAALGTGSIAVGTGATLAGTVAIPVPAGATLSGAGTVSAPVSVSGTLSPGSVGPGALTAGAGVAFTAGSTFAVNLNGTAPGTGYDQLLLSGATPTLTLGSATLAATLGYAPAAGDRLFVVVITDPTGAVSGTFAGVPQDGTVTIGGFAANISYAGDSAAASLTGGNDVVFYNFTPVPEPGFVLLACGAVAGLGARWRRRQAA